MAEMVLAPSRGDGKEENFIQKFSRAFVRGDAFTKLSLLVWGLGYIGHGQLIKALLVTLVQGLGLYFLGTSGIPALKKFGTLGTVQMEMQFNPVTLKNEVNNYDNSFAILLLSVIALVVIVSLVVATMMVVQSNYLLQQQKAAGKKPNSFRQDINCYLNEKFYVTLLTLPVLGVVVFTIVPLFILIAVAFTNYDQQHMPPAALFTWVGLANFASLFGGQSLSMTFSYAFGKVLSWTLVWAFFATFTNFFGGVFLAMFINNKNTKCPRLWRTLFMITIAVPQFVTLLLVRNFFSDEQCGRHGSPQNHRTFGAEHGPYPVSDGSALGQVHDRYDQHLGRRSVPDADCHRRADEHPQRYSVSLYHRRRQPAAVLYSYQAALPAQCAGARAGDGFRQECQQLQCHLPADAGCLQN